ncbi:MAG: orotidine 5'-phosphate decarboxylase, partial [Saprospiraceae bacterium]|nr:orotidine 5'-phosphate decarboxylase [Saprospiraceae bacterium]
KLQLKDGSYLFETVLKEASKWGSPENLMYVVGATNAASLTQIRAIIPDHFLLIPGIGAQGGDIQEVITKGKNSEIGLLINVSRSIIYASNGEDFSLKAQEEAKNINAQYQSLLG